MAWLRTHAEEYHIDKNRIITMGFSAGGHLAASYGDFWKNHEFLAKELGVEIYYDKRAQELGALGAALYAYGKSSQS